MIKTTDLNIKGQQIPVKMMTEFKKNVYWLLHIASNELK